MMPCVKKRSRFGIKQKDAAVPMLPTSVRHFNAELLMDSLPQMIAFAPLARAVNRIPAEAVEPDVVSGKGDRTCFVAEYVFALGTDRYNITIDITTLARQLTQCAVEVCF